MGLIDVDGHNFPNIPLMKISAYYKEKGETVEWYRPNSGRYDVVYASKVFSFTPDLNYEIDANCVIRGGTGYAIGYEYGREIYYEHLDKRLSRAVEHMYPDYGLYPELTKDTAYGFLTRGCPRRCEFCHVGAKEGKVSHKVAELSEFWRGQKNIVLCDPNILACSEADELLEELGKTGSYIDFNQGLDIRLMTEKRAELIKRLKVKMIHFAWDRLNEIENETIVENLKMFKRITGIDIRRTGVYVLCNFDTTLQQDIERINTIRSLGHWPYVMLYNKGSIPRGHDYKKLQRWVNNRSIFSQCESFGDYLKYMKGEK